MARSLQLEPAQDVRTAVSCHGRVCFDAYVERRRESERERERDSKVWKDSVFFILAMVGEPELQEVPFHSKLSEASQYLRPSQGSSESGPCQLAAPDASC